MITTLSQLVALTESGNCLHALRFEPGWRYTTDVDVRNCIHSHAPAYMNAATARSILAMSWGKYQIMASNLYALGYRSTMARFQTDESVQDKFYSEYVISRGINFTLGEILDDESKRTKFAIKYNGSAAYGASLLRNYAEAKKGGT